MSRTGLNAKFLLAMKKSFLLLALAGFLTTQAYATSVKSSGTSPRKAPKANLEQQLAKYILYPEILKQTQQPGVVVIQFRVNSDSELAQLTVFSQNEELNNTLLRQLTGKKLTGYAGIGDELHTVRLRFRP